MGTGDDLKNRSTSYDAESAGLQLRPVRTGPTTDGAGRKWSAEKWVTSPAPALYTTETRARVARDTRVLCRFYLLSYRHMRAKVPQYGTLRAG